MSITLAAGSIVAGSQNPAGAAVEQQVRAELAANGSTVFWVYLREQADLSQANALADRKALGRFVHRRLVETADTSQADLRKLLESAGARYRTFWIANTVQVIGDAALLDRIARLPEVAQITSDRQYELPEPLPTQEQPRVQSVEWGIDRINAPRVWSELGVTGEEIVVGSIDTGAMFDHPALVNQYRGNRGGGQFDHNYAWWDPTGGCGSPSLVPCDTNGHGTHTIGTMVGDDGAGNQTRNQIGVAPGAKWIAAKGCEARTCSNGALLSAGQFMLAPTDLRGDNPNPDLRPHVVNNSWGGAASTDPWFRQTVRAWEEAGIFPQFSSGNSNGSAPCSSASNPGNLPESYAAGAFDINNAIAPFSNRGPSAWDGLIKPNISAPGVAVRSAWVDGGYHTISGTSMASPHVAGTVALMWSAAPELVRNIGATRERLDRTAIDTEDLSCGGTPEHNNVWGQGRLDAYAAVADSPQVPTGTLTGTVTDSVTGNPIAGATVALAGEVERVRTTGGNGRYTFNLLPVGSHRMTVTAFGYTNRTATVTIADGETTTADVPLEAAPTFTVSGRITDDSGHGWPLWAEVSAAGTTASAVTDPATGQYRLRLPVGATYQLVARSRYPGYADVTATVKAGDGDLTHDIRMQVNACGIAPGYEFRGNVGVLGDDENAALTGFLNARGIAHTVIGWGDDVSTFDTVIVNTPDYPDYPQRDAFLKFLDETDAAGVGVVFLDTVPHAFTGISLLQELVGNPSGRDALSAPNSPSLYYEVTQPHPVLAGFEVGERVMLDETSDFKDYAFFSGYRDEGRTVIADAARADRGVVGSGIGVQQRPNNRHVLLSMHGATSFAGPQFWHQDGVQVFLNALEWTGQGALGCHKVDGGLVIGRVADLNTDKPVRGATVASAGKPADAGNTAADGFYWLFSSLTGSRSFRASHERYSEDVTTINVAADSVTVAGFAMPAGRLAIAPANLNAEVRFGQKTDRTFTITNTGSAPATVGLREQRATFELRDARPRPTVLSDETGGVKLIHGDFSPALAMPKDRPTPTAPVPTPAAVPWQTVADYPHRITDNGAATGDGKVYSFGGSHNFAVLASTYAFDPATGQWSRRADMPQWRIKPAAVAIDGLVYVVGGTDHVGMQATTFVYNPATDTWSQAADMPGGRAASGAAEVDGRLYLVGGCVDMACAASNDTLRYDPATDRWQVLTPYPKVTAWLGCAGIDGILYCTGGTDNATSHTSTYAYDPASDTWTARADLPYDNWGMAYGAANGQLVVSSGVTNGSTAITNRGAAYDPISDTWRAIEPAGVPVYRTASACGFYKIGGTQGGAFANPIAAVERHAGFSDCAGGVDVPWLTANPATTTLQPGESVTVAVTLDSQAAKEQQPGTYTAGIWLRHDTPYGVGPIAVKMDAAPPGNWGRITGTVTGVNCQGAKVPLAATTIQLNGNHVDVTLVTGHDGGYTYWLPAQRLTVAAAKEGHSSEVQTVHIQPHRSVDANFALRATCTG